MTTSPTSAAPPTTAPTGDRPPLRLELHAGAKGSTDGTWWPRSRDLPTEAADLLDHFPESAGRINRLLFSRPDWDNATEDGHSLHRVIARRGPVKIGSFPSDDTHLMILSMASGQRLRLDVVPSDVDEAEGDRRMRAAAEGTDLG